MAHRIAGIAASVSSASGQLIRTMMITMNSSTKLLSNSASTPDVNISFSASTSEVTRVTSLPTGLRSKNTGLIRCRCRYISDRISNMIFCPVHCIR